MIIFKILKKLYDLLLIKWNSYIYYVLFSLLFAVFYSTRYAGIIFTRVDKKNILMNKKMHRNKLMWK